MLGVSSSLFSKAYFIPVDRDLDVSSFLRFPFKDWSWILINKKLYKGSLLNTHINRI